MTDTVARVEHNVIADGVSIWLAEGAPGLRNQLIWYHGPMATLKQYVAGTAPETPSLILTEGAARALLDALLDHFGHATGGRLQRADFEHERARRDRLEDALIKMVVEDG